MSTGIGAMMAGGNGVRQKDDFYPTPKDCVLSLARNINLPNKIWEPACGDGAISKVLESKGHEVYSTDLVDRGYGVPNRDFLLEQDYKPDKDSAIITNPPFNIAVDFILKAISYNIDCVAILLKSSYWHASSRTQLFINHPPSHILALNYRPDFLSKGAPTMEVCWNVWKAGYKGTKYDVVGKG